MIYEIEITEQDDADLREIFEYLAVEVLSPQNASGQLDRLEESIMKLVQLPERFRVYDKEPWRSRGLRIMPVENYCVFYISDESKRMVTVIRVLYGSRNVDEQLR